MARGGARPNSGRPKGSQKMFDASLFVARIENSLKGKGSPNGLISIAEELLSSDEPRIRADIWKVLVSYKFGKPKESHELTGADGGPIALQIVDTAGMRG